MSLLSDGVEGDDDTNNDEIPEPDDDDSSNKIGRTNVQSDELRTPVVETRNALNDLPQLVTNSGPGQRQRSLPPTVLRDYCDEDDDSASNTETEESSSDDFTTPFPTFDYGEFHSEPDTLLSTLETQSDHWASPKRNATGFTTASALTTTNQQGVPSSGAGAGAAEAATRGDLQDEENESKSIQESSSLVLVPRLYDDGERRGIPSAGQPLLSRPWLVHFLSQFRRQANRRRIATVSCSHPQCKYSARGSGSYLSLQVDLRLLMQYVWVKLFRWICSQEPMGSADRWAVLEHSSTLLVNHRQLTSRRSATTPKESQATTRTSEYRYNLLNFMRGKDGCMSSRFQLGRRRDRIETRRREIETRRRELLAIVPYRSNHDDHGVLLERNDDRCQEVSPQLWETALMAGYCAWKHYQTDRQQEDNSNPSGTVKTAALRNDSSAMATDPSQLDDEKQNEIVPVQQSFDFEEGPTDAAGTDCFAKIQQSTSRRRKKHKNVSDSPEVPSKRLKTTPSTVNDLNRVLLEEKSRRLKARSKELSMLQRFGLCSGQDPNDEDLLESSSSEADIDDHASIGRPMPSTVPEAKIVRLSQSDPPGPPLRCGSPSSLDRKLKRKHISSATGGSTVLEERQLAKKKPKHGTRPVQEECKEATMTLPPDINAAQQEPSSSTDRGEEQGTKSTNRPEVSQEVDLPSHSPPSSPLLPSTLGYDDVSSTHSLHDAAPSLSVSMESPVLGDQKSDPLASRASPLTYDDDAELSARAKSMLQALENRRFQVGNADLSNCDVDPGVNQIDTSGKTRILSKRERKQLRKEAKAKRKEAKKKRKKAKLSKKNNPNVAHASSPKSLPSAHCRVGDAGKNPQPGETLVIKQNNNKVRTASLSEQMQTKEIDFGPSQGEHLGSSQGVCQVPLSTRDAEKLPVAQSNSNATGPIIRQQDRPAPRPEAISALPLLTPPAHSNTQAATTSEDTSRRHERSSIRLLCSESFVEQWGDVVAKLASGTWDAPSGETRICFLDTSLVDYVGVDIENQAEGGVIVCLLSTTVRSGFSRLLKRVVDIASQSRYVTLEVVICADIDIEESAATNGIARLQNAVMRYKGVPKTLVSFQVSSPSSLARCLADALLVEGGIPASNDESNFIEHRIANKKTWERLRFLLSIIPTLRVRKAFEIVQLLGTGDQGDSWLQRLFDNAHMQNSALKDVISADVREQLLFALSTPLGR